MRLSLDTKSLFALLREGKEICCYYQKLLRKPKDDLQFLDNALKTVLATYQNYFRKRFIEGLSIRRHADAHQLNRGSVDYHIRNFSLSWLVC